MSGAGETARAEAPAGREERPGRKLRPPRFLGDLEPGPRAHLRELEDPELRELAGGYDWSLLPLERVRVALAAADAAGEWLVTVTVPGINFTWVASRQWAERVVRLRSGFTAEDSDGVKYGGCTAMPPEERASGLNTEEAG